MTRRSPSADPVSPADIVRVSADTSAPDSDALAVEEPLETRLGYGPLADRQRLPAAVTMRTPGHDAELAVGYLFAEGVVRSPADVLAVEPAGDSGNVVRVELHPSVVIDSDRFARASFVSSACGVCGKTTLDALEVIHDGPPAGGPLIPAHVIHSLPERTRSAQPGFARTGGVHAAALFTAAGELLAVREDVGRHNAVDKLIGWAFRAGHLPLHGRVLFVSGRAGFELAQKAAAAGASVLAAVGAPTTLAVRTAERFGLGLAGFVRDGRFNVYAGAERFALDRS